MVAAQSGESPATKRHRRKPFGTIAEPGEVRRSIRYCLCIVWKKSGGLAAEGELSLISVGCPTSGPRPNTLDALPHRRDKEWKSGETDWMAR